MNLMKLAYKNLRRRKIRSILTTIGISVAVAVFVALLGFNNGFKQALTRDIDRMGYQVLITAKGCPYEAATMMLQGGGGLRYMPEKIYDSITQDQRIDKISPHFVATAFDPEKAGGRGAITLYTGILKNYFELKPWIEFESGSFFSSDTAAEAILGYEIAELEQRQLNDLIFIPNYNAVLKVVGILKRTGTQDDGVVFLPLKTAQKIFKQEEKLTGIGVKLKNIEDLPAFEESLYDIPEIQVVSLAQVKSTFFNLIRTTRLMATLVAIIAIFVAIIGVVNTILMSVFERTREIGVMKAIGASSLDIFKLIWAETILICLSGGILGTIIAALGGGFIEFIARQLLPYAPSGKLILLNPTLILFSLLGAIGIGILTGLFPALRASSMKPVEAIRSTE